MSCFRQGICKHFLKGLNSKYSRLCGTRGKIEDIISYLIQPFKNVSVILSLRGGVLHADSLLDYLSPLLILGFTEFFC